MPEAVDQQKPNEENKEETKEEQPLTEEEIKKRE